MRYVFEHLAVAVCAITGILAATNKHVDLFGVIVLALVTALGGGTLRDLILGIDPFWVADPSYVWNAVGTALVMFMAVRFWSMPSTLLLIADACGLALFTVVGAERAMAHSVSATVAIMLGVMTGVAGGMIRDLLTGEIPMVLRAGIYLYATAALCGASVYVLLATWFGQSAGAAEAEPSDFASPLGAQSIAIAVTLVLRLAAIRWHLRLPEFTARA